MKYLKIYEDFNTPKYNKEEKLNEEWFPQGPYFSLIDDKRGTIAEIYTTNDGKQNGIKFIGGQGDHEEQIKNIINKLYNEKFEDNFSGSYLDDITINYLMVFNSNLPNKKYDGFLDYLGESDSNEHNVIITLEKPIEIKIEESDKKNEVKFNKKINKLMELLEFADLEYNKELDEFLDTCISEFSKYVIDDED